MARVLVTRPKGQAQPLCEALRAAGHNAHSQPLLELQPLPEVGPELRALIADLDLFQHIIFISGNAVRFGLSLVDDYWPQLPVGVNWYAIGGVTAGLLAERGLRALSPRGDMTSEGLLARPELRDIEGDRILLVKGEGGRDTLRRELQQRGARVQQLACYRRLATQLQRGALAQRLAAWEIDIILLSSGEGLANMLRLLSPEETTNLGTKCLLVPSGRVAALARDAGFNRVIMAENASDAAMLRALKQQYPGIGEN